MRPAYFFSESQNSAIEKFQNQGTFSVPANLGWMKPPSDLVEIIYDAAILYIGLLQPGVVIKSSFGQVLG